MAATPKSVSSSGDDPGSALLVAIEARRLKAEARAAAIEAGEVSVVDPREQRLKERKEAERAEKAAKALKAKQANGLDSRKEFGI